MFFTYSNNMTFIFVFSIFLGVSNIYILSIKTSFTETELFYNSKNFKENKRLNEITGQGHAPTYQKRLYNQHSILLNFAVKITD